MTRGVTKGAWRSVVWARELFVVQVYERGTTGVSRHRRSKHFDILAKLRHVYLFQVPGCDGSLNASI